MIVAHLSPPRILLEQYGNEMIVHCPSPVALAAMTDYLTYERPVTERQHGRLVNLKEVEPCYRCSTTDPLAFYCPAGFESMLLAKFNGRFEFSVVRERDHRIAENTRADWSRIDASEFRNGQQPILEAMVEADRGRLVLAPAVGKSWFIGCYARLMPKARILVSTKSKEVLFQLYEDLERLLPGRVGLVCSGRNKKPDARIVCVSQGTLERYFPRDGTPNVDVVIVDEYHEWGSPRKLEVLSGIKQAKLFGLSGNKFRDDGAEFRLDGIFGPVLAEMTHAEAVTKKLVVPICVVWVPVRSDLTPIRETDSIDSRQRYGVWQYSVRNRMIAEAARLFREDDQVLISVRTVEHALFLRQYLPEFTPVYAPQDGKASNIGMFRAMGLTRGLPAMTEERLRLLKRRFADGTLKKVIATGVWSRGVNFPGLSVVIRADGMNSTIADTQWPGRTARISDGKEVSLVIDFTDEYDDSLWHKAIRRQQRYAEQQWKQIELADLKQMMRRSVPVGGA